MTGDYIKVGNDVQEILWTVLQKVQRADCSEVLFVFGLSFGRYAFREFICYLPVIG